MRIEHEILLALVYIALFILAILYRRHRLKVRREQRRDYYRNVYLKSEDWGRKRYLVLKRDGWRCVHCGGRATQVHHKKYARNIGKEPIQWLESACESCHVNIHQY